MPLKTKVVLMVAVVTVCLGTGAMLTAIYMTRQAVSRVALNHIKTLITQQEIATSHIFADSASFVKHLGMQEQLISYVARSSPREQDPALLAYINGLAMSERYQAIYIMDKEGNTLTSTDPTFVGQNYGFRDYVKAALAGQPAVDAAIGVTSKKFGYYFSHPIRAESGDVLGVVAIKLKEELFIDALQPAGLSAEGGAMLVDRYGVVIQSNQSDLLFKSLGVLAPEIQQEIAKTKRFGNVDIGTMGYELVARELVGLREESQEFTVRNEITGRDELIGVARITDTPFFLVLVESRQFFIQLTGYMAIRSGLLVLTTALVATGLLIFLMLWILKPIGQLKEVVQQIKRGDDIKRITLETGDELEDLGEAFNTLMTRVKTGCESAKDELQSRAAELEQFKLAVESASDHIIITDLDGRILHANKTAEDITGYSRNELIGCRPSLWGRQMPKKFYKDMWATIKDRKMPFHAEMMNRRKNGEQYVAEMHIAPLLDDKGELRGFVGIGRDITAQKNADRAKTDFVSIASHQLRTPLAAINWYVEMLSGENVGPINKMQRTYLKQIHEASTQMVDLVGSLLGVSRIDTGSLHMNPKPIILSAMADSVIDELWPIAEKKHITITKEYGPKLGPIDIDPSMIRVVFQNLLSNALKYTPENGVVTISVTQNSDSALIAVTDTGYGIPAAQHNMIFTKFFRADNAREMEPEGSGLGLYIARSIIEHAQGTIGFSSEEGKGSTFRVSLPLTDIKEQANDILHT